MANEEYFTEQLLQKKKKKLFQGIQCFTAQEIMKCLNSFEGRPIENINCFCNVDFVSMNCVLSQANK